MLSPARNIFQVFESRHEPPAGVADAVGERRCRRRLSLSQLHLTLIHAIAIGGELRGRT